MNKELIQDQRLKQLPLLVFLNVLNQQQEMCLSFDLIFFLFIYSFILADNTSKNFFSKRKITHHREISILKRNGARYLDPKYSRWLSTDPALSSYVEKNYEGHSGGIYNSVNLNLYHYGGNNPIKYVDPDGREEYDSSITYEQWIQIPECKWLRTNAFSSERILAGKTWSETQDFFKMYPNGCIYRNPDEFAYRYYTNEGKDKPHYYNMYTADELFIFGIGKGLFSLGKGLFNLASKGLANAGDSVQ